MLLIRDKDEPTIRINKGSSNKSKDNKYKKLKLNKRIYL
jgi:hypothetical protein